MDADKIEKLETAGFAVGDTTDLLGLTSEEVEQIDARSKRNAENRFSDFSRI